MESAEHKAQARSVNNKKTTVSRGGRKRVPKKITENYLHNSGLYYLQRFAASKAHFKSVMMRKVRRSCQYYPEQNPEECRALVDALADKFQAAGLLNEDLYLQAAATSLRRQGRSAKAIRARLFSKGFKSEQIDESLQKMSDLENKSMHDLELEAALRFARKKKIGRFRPKTADVYDSKKELGALARAGFSYEISRQVLGYDKGSAESDSYF